MTAASLSAGVAVLHLGTIKIELDKVTAVASSDGDLPAAEVPEAGV